MKTTVKTIYQLDMSPETAECLLALIYCNLCSHNASPLDSLFCELKTALGIEEGADGDNQISALADKYEKFV